MAGRKKPKIQLSQSSERTGKKLTQTVIYKYFKGFKGIPIHEEKLQGKNTRGKRNSSKKRNTMTEIDSNESEMEKVSGDASFIGIKKKKLVAKICSDDEGSETENDQSSLNIPKNNAGSTSTPTTPQFRSEELKISEHTSTPKVQSIKGLKKVNRILDYESPSTSGITITPNHSKSVNNVDNIKDVDISKNIKILNNILISPSKNPDNKSFISEKTITKKEEKKLNFDTLRVMKQFFLNVLHANHLKCLLSENNTAILYKLFNIEKNYQYTCIKLFMWKPVWYNIFKYAEKIGLEMDDNEINLMYNCLKDNKLVDSHYLNEDLYTLLDLLSLKQLREIQRSFKFPNPCSTRGEIIERLLKHCKTQGTLTCKKSTEQVLKDRVREKLGFCVKLSNELAKALSSIYILNTFTNCNFLRYQEYFRNLNIIFPDYATEDLQIFTKEEFHQYAEALELRRELENAIEKKNMPLVFQICSIAFSVLKDEKLNSSSLHQIKYLEYYTARSMYISILSSGSNLLKSAYYNDVKSWLEFLISQNYCSHKRGHWYCLLSLIYTQYLKDYEGAAKLIISAFKKEKEHLTEVQLYELAFRGKVLDKKTYNLPLLYHDEIASLSPSSCDVDWPTAFTEGKAMRSNELGHKRKYVEELENGDKNYLTVEQIALEHYKKSGFPSGLHCEGSIICAAFCLLFWDIIYNSYVKGAFISKTQDAPLDMYTKYFYLNREHSIKERLNEIQSNWKDEELKYHLTKNWDFHSHETSLCPIDSVIDNSELLYQVIECISRPILAQIFERLVKNYKVYHSGFPDLIVWNYEMKKAKFVEVKGENDHLSIKQKLWLKYLMDIGANAELCNVHSKGSKKKNVKKSSDE